MLQKSNLSWVQLLSAILVSLGAAQNVRADDVTSLDMQPMTDAQAFRIAVAVAEGANSHPNSVLGQLFRREVVLEQLNDDQIKSLELEVKDLRLPKYSGADARVF